MFSSILALGLFQRAENWLKLQDCFVLVTWNGSLSKVNCPFSCLLKYVVLDKNLYLMNDQTVVYFMPLGASLLCKRCGLPRAWCGCRLFYLPVSSLRARLTSLIPVRTHGHSFQRKERNFCRVLMPVVSADGFFLVYLTVPVDDLRLLSLLSVWGSSSCWACGVHPEYLPAVVTSLTV